MKDKICLITGANRGIGKSAARELARLGARVVMVCRDPQLGQAAREGIMQDTGNLAVELLTADLSDLEEVRRLAEAYQARHNTLHVLVNNAGVVKRHRVITPDGHETTFAVNHLAPFLLTGLLLDTLKAGAPARIVNVNSMVHRWGRIDFDDLTGQARYGMHRAYNQAKLANLLFTRELARRLDPAGVTVNAVHPGMVATDFGREYTGLTGLMANRFWRPFMKSPARGADTVVYLASSPEVEEVSGRYFANRKARRPSRASRNLKLARRLWEVSEELVGLE